MECDCCKKRVPYRKIWTKGSILFNGCRDCWGYLTKLMKDTECKKCKKPPEPRLKLRRIKEGSKVSENGNPYLAIRVRKMKIKSAYGMNYKYFDGNNDGIERVARAIEDGEI